jgi:hypothetical protein
MRLYMEPYANGGVLAGSIDGQRAFADLVQKTEVPAKPEAVFLDFNGVAVATASFLRDSIVAYRNHARSNWPSLYPVAANLAPRVREELDGWLKDRGEAFIVCSLDADGIATEATVIGVVDGKQGIALAGVVTLGETDVPTLAKHVDEDVAQTAWNNRLGALVTKGLIIEVTRGRNKRYRPILEGLKHGA